MGCRLAVRQAYPESRPSGGGRLSEHLVEHASPWLCGKGARSWDIEVGGRWKEEEEGMVSGRLNRQG